MKEGERLLEKECSKDRYIIYIVQKGIQTDISILYTSYRKNNNCYKTCTFINITVTVYYYNIKDSWHLLQLISSAMEVEAFHLETTVRHGNFTGSLSPKL